VCEFDNSHIPTGYNTGKAARRGLADAGCGAEQDHALLCGERRRHLCHGYSRRQLFANAAIAASRDAA